MPAPIDPDHLLAGLPPRPLYGLALQPPLVDLVPAYHTALFLPPHLRPLLIRRLPPLELLPEAVGPGTQSRLVKPVLQPRQVCLKGDVPLWACRVREVVERGRV